ncbi:MAG: Uma2 family endonuclease [Deltaproteobacteria bacterium]|nr:Uma2 family endonuclease [Deltaproteobacteria bacterium]
MQTQAATSSPPIEQPVEPRELPQRVILRGISWQTYESLLADLAECSGPRLTFDHGVLEIMSPTFEHDEYNRILALLVEVVAEEMHISVRNFGSATFKRLDLVKGFEPDSCFYIQSVSRIRGKRKVELPQDPPPDLLIEIDVTSSSLGRFPIFAQVGAPEVWRYDGSQVQILLLANGQYQIVERSTALPLLTATMLTEFLEAGIELDRLEWLGRLRSWVRQHNKA